MRNWARNLFASFLTLAARIALYRHQPVLIVVVGPVGKTTIKDAIFAALAPLGAVRKSEKSHNTPLSVPLAILGLPVPNAFWGWGVAAVGAWWRALTDRSFPRWLVLELGTDRPGDMEHFCCWLSPHIVVGSWFPEVPPHVEFFPEAESVYAEDWRILNALPANGTVVVNADDDFSLAYVQRVLKNKSPVLAYGYTHNADVRLRRYSLLTTRRQGVVIPRGIRVTITNRLNRERIVVHRFGVVGATHAYPWAAAAAVRLALGFPLAGLDAAARVEPPTPGRLRSLEGKGGMVLIDDTYNASPDATAAALETLRELPQQRKVAVLGDMLELGAHTQREHEKAGAHAAHIANCVITVGLRARRLAAAAREAGAKEVIECSSPQEAANYILRRPEWHTPNTAVLLKASRGIHLEEAVRALLAHPQHDAALTVGGAPASHLS
ncbi:MAG: UDP-N-acetylmuramoyl-tripeptide--D-alanyl-D-alanine ligase [Candidatus Parcubacteria bacterium]|nr:MAG: UDP-N-acetylmuramoyl-tripeptide--D-alanyl-D-alanine ligase [Candidatus Parcubacteria bacterium]